MAISNVRIDKIKELKSILENLNRTDPAVQARIDQIINIDLGLAADINAHLDSPRGSSTETTLAHYAAKENYAVILDYLNKKYKTATPPVDFEAKDARNKTSAYHAVKKANLEAIRSLVRAGADFTKSEIVTELKKNPDLQKFLNNCQDAQKFEDQIKADPDFFKTADQTAIDTFLGTLNDPQNAKDDKGWNVAHQIANYGREDILLHLIEKDINLMAPNDKGDTPIKLIRDPNLQARIQTAYRTRLSQKGLDGVEWDKVTLTEIKSLVDFGADVNKGPYAHQALRAGKTEIVEYLISKGIDLNASDSSGKTLVELAADHGDERILMDLVEHSFKDPATRVNWHPSGTDVLDEMRRLGKNALADKVQDAFNATESLLDLSSSGLGVSWDDIQPDQIQELLDKGARINAQNEEGKTALYQATEANNLDAAKRLLEKGANPNIADKNENTPAHLAAQNVIETTPTKKGKDQKILQADFIQLLAEAENKADFNKQNEPDKKTPVHILFEKINEAYEDNKANKVTQIPEEVLGHVVENLVKAGANFDIEDAGGQKPEEYLKNDDLKKIIKEQIENAKAAAPTEEEIGPTETPTPEPDRAPTSTPDGRSAADGSGAGDSSGITDPDKAHPGLGKRLSDALKESTENFCKNVFEANHNTAEDFAEAFLFNLLAFPLDASSTLLSKVYTEDEKDKLDKLIRRLDRLMADRADGSGGSVDRIPASQLTKDLGALKKAVLTTTDPVALQKLQGIVGPAPDINATKEQRDEYMKKVADAFRDNPDIQDAFKKAFETIAKDPEGKALMERCFAGHTGTLSNDQILSVLTGIPVDKLATRTADSHAPTDGPVVPEGSTPKIQEAIMKSYQKIMDSDSLDKDAKKLQLEAFLQKQAEEHPEFKTLAKAFTLSQRKTAILNSLKKDPAYLTKSGNITNKGVTFLHNKKEFDGFSRAEIKETVKMATTLRETLKKGSEEGKAYLAGKLQEKAAKIER